MPASTSPTCSKGSACAGTPEVADGARARIVGAMSDIHVTGVDFVALQTRDHAAAAKFYGETLGRFHGPLSISGCGSALVTRP